MLELALGGAHPRAALLLLDGPSEADAGEACRKVLRRADRAASLGAGRVAVLAPHLRETGGSADLAARLIGALPAPAAAQAAIGIALAPDDAPDWAGLMVAAETALDRARAYEDGRFAFVDATLDARYRIGPLLSGAISRAVSESQFRLVYQPITSLAGGGVVGVEALVRWPRPGGEEWAPGVFIPEAERRGLVAPITDWTLRAACARIAAGAPDGFSVGVNLSAAMLGDGAARMVADALAASGVEAARLTIEITETAPFIDDARAVEDVAAIRALGCRIAIDDFGAGHASLDYVVKLPAERIKLDSGLTRAFLTDRRARAAIRATAALAAEIGADVVAEGVASADVAAALAETGVEFGQGRLFGPPGDFPFA